MALQEEKAPGGGALTQVEKRLIRGMMKQEGAILRRFGGSGREKRTAFWRQAFVRLGLLLGVLALVSQGLTLAAPMGGRAGDARLAQAALSRIVGTEVIVCTQDDAPNAPPGSDCHDSCPLCRLAADAAALALPPLPLVAGPVPGAVAEIDAPTPASVVTPAPALPSPPRGPPSKS